MKNKREMKKIDQNRGKLLKYWKMEEIEQNKHKIEERRENRAKSVIFSEIGYFQ